MAKLGFTIAKNFLKDYVAFRNFKIEILHGYSSSYNDYWEYCREHGLEDDFIQDTFDWDDTRKGYEYWNYIDTEWRMHGND